MSALFADAGYWIALFDPLYRLNPSAVAWGKSIAGRRIITSQFVLMHFTTSTSFSLDLCRSPAKFSAFHIRLCPISGGEDALRCSLGSVLRIHGLHRGCSRRD